MPIFEYQCETCGTAFEALVPASDARPECAQCGSPNVAKQFSTFSAPAAAGAEESPCASMGCGRAGTGCASTGCPSAH